ncbi:phage tail assembly protein [Pseudomonas fluvialis]|uniref:Phage tail assembly protein n=1 Tax=Pseudomonas fluvialis TaxID=1793966 RepID=A0A2I0CP78_9PSED|nr:phage tail assembly protein [Pseudomonas pharmacofabricae]PKF70883.1 phage tail assembly protein [Pseudomonas pharmacofabricae]
MATPEPTDKAQNPAEVVIELDTPIKRGETTHDKLTLRKPMSGELRGVTLVDLVQMDVLALRKVLPRISTPSLTDAEIGTMDPADLLACGVAVSGFLLQKSAKEAALVA